MRQRSASPSIFLLEVVLTSADTSVEPPSPLVRSISPFPPVSSTTQPLLLYYRYLSSVIWLIFTLHLGSLQPIKFDQVCLKETLVMEEMLKKYQQRFRKVRENMSDWDVIQSRLLSLFGNASSIIQRLQVIQDSKNFGSLKSVDGIKDVLVAKQMESLQTIMLSMKNTLEDFRAIVLSLEKIHRDSKQLLKGVSSQSSKKEQQHQRIGIKPTLADCLEGLRVLHEMHQSEYLLKSSVVSALSVLTLKPSGSDLGALQQLLVDEPNIPKEEVQHIFDIIFAEEIR